MQHIALEHTLPVVFQHEGGRQSGVWLQDIVFSRGERILISAQSGQGKSSLASFIYGQRQDYLGTIRFDATDIRSLRRADWDRVRQGQLAMLFQELRLFPELTALENVQMKNRLSGPYKTEAEITILFERLGVADRLHTPVARMSYGQQQRVALIRALCQPFDFLLADEPISHLDDANAQVMASLIREEADARGAGVIITSIGKHFDLNYTHRFSL